MSEKQGKVWGETSCLFSKNNVEIHRILANKGKGAKCSNHQHKNKFNMFFVEEGTLLVRVWKNDYELVDETILNPGDSVTVKPGEFHQFENRSDSVIAYEIYWTELDPNDIERKDCGTAPEPLTTDDDSV